MKLYATGFNAWSQLRFGASAKASQTEDIYEFEVVLEGHSIKRPVSGLSYTSGCTAPRPSYKPRRACN